METRFYVSMREVKALGECGWSPSLGPRLNKKEEVSPCDSCLVSLPSHLQGLSHLEL